MRRDEFAAQKRAEAEGNDHRVIAAADRAGDRRLTTAELAILTGIPVRTARASVARLKDKGLLDRASRRGRLLLTLAGRTEAGAAVPGLALMPELDRALEVFPSMAQRSFARLAASALVARHHLDAHYSNDWPAFIAMGGTGEGKTWQVRVQERIFGPFAQDPVVFARGRAPGELFGRRVQALGNLGFVFMPSPLLSLPLLCLDEWDDATEEFRSQARELVLGSSRPQKESAVVVVKPLVMLTMNTENASAKRLLRLVPLDFRRRAVVIDTSELAPLMDDLDLRVKRLVDSGAIPKINLGRLRCPATKLSTELWELLRDRIREGLTPAGRKMMQVESLSRIVLGRAALQGDGDLRRATLATALDYLNCASTTGHTVANYRARLEAELGAEQVLLIGAATAEAQLASIREQRAQVTNVAHDQLVGDRAQLQQEVLNVRAFRRTDDPLRARCRAQLTDVVKKIKGTRSAESLEAVRRNVKAYVLQAQDFLAEDQREAADQRQEVEQRKQAAERKAETERRRKADKAAAEKQELEAKREAKRANRERLQEVDQLMPFRYSRFEGEDLALRRALVALAIDCPPNSSARSMWQAERRRLNANMVFYGGKSKKPPVYKAIQTDPFGILPAVKTPQRALRQRTPKRAPEAKPRVVVGSQPILIVKTVPKPKIQPKSMPKKKRGWWGGVYG